MNTQATPNTQPAADDLFSIVELEDRLELASAADDGRCDRCNDNKYPEIPIVVTV